MTLTLVSNSFSVNSKFVYKKDEKENPRIQCTCQKLLRKGVLPHRHPQFRTRGFYLAFHSCFNR